METFVLRFGVKIFGCDYLIPLSDEILINGNEFSVDRSVFDCNTKTLIIYLK